MNKKKRCSTGYNLFIQSCTKEKPFAECITDGKWKGLSDKEKNRWKELAKNKCDV